MERATIKDLNISTREEGLIFLKRLWNNEETKCPKCGEILEIMHKKAKKDNCDWKCTKCDMSYKTMYLLDELNDKF